MSFIPTTIKEGNGSFDFIMISGDAYVDHPSFGHAVVCRLFEEEGFSVGIIPQPITDEDFLKLGEPNVSFLISTGVADSMVNNYTANLRRRSTDEYSPNNKSGKRPDRALISYSKTLKRLFPNSYIIAGGVEASLRRFAHYDYWSNSVMQSILMDSKADLIIYGAGEKPIWDICALLKRNIPIEKIHDVKGTCYVTTFDKMESKIKDAFLGNHEKFIQIESYNEVLKSKISFVKAYNKQVQNSDSISGKGIIQEQNEKKFLIQNPPSLALTTKEMDKTFDLPYERDYHPMYKKFGGIKALDEVKFSITSHRGCFGNCSFCSITYHMGRRIQKRSKDSIIREAKILTELPGFKGYIHDLGGATANFRNPSCKNQIKNGVCANKDCIGSNVCKNLIVDHNEYLDLLRTLRKLPNVKKVFIRSGVRFDYLMYDQNQEFFEELVKYHISGQLKTAPEHASDNVLKLMNKPDFSVYQKFTEKFYGLTSKFKMKEFIVPYFIASHPGCELIDAVKLTKYLKKINYMPLAVQDFYPTPSTRSTCMYYTGVDPKTMKKVHVPTKEERKMQRALLQYRKKENFSLVRKALTLTGNSNLIGNGKECIVPLDIINNNNRNFKNNRRFNHNNLRRKPRK